MKEIERVVNLDFNQVMLIARNIVKENSVLKWKVRVTDRRKV